MTVQVDEVVSGVPYVMNDEYLRRIISEHRIDYVVHGDDPCIVDGRDVYESAVKMGKVRQAGREAGRQGGTRREGRGVGGEGVEGGRGEGGGAGGEVREEGRGIGREGGG